MAHALEVEIEQNHAAFLDMLDELVESAKGQYALLRDARLEGLFASAGEAEREGFRRFTDRLYSIQQVDAEPVDLGFYSYAISQGQGSAESHQSEGGHTRL